VTWRKRKESLKVINSFELLESSTNDEVLVFLVDTICILEITHLQEMRLTLGGRVEILTTHQKPIFSSV
jgi:hypothetical protein